MGWRHNKFLSWALFCLGLPALLAWAIVFGVWLLADRFIVRYLGTILALGGIVLALAMWPGLLRVPLFLLLASTGFLILWVFMED